MSNQQPPGWLPDPTGRHQQRYWDGARWTEHVVDNGVTSIDPLTPAPPAGPPPGYGYQPMGATGPQTSGGSRTPLFVVLGLLVVVAVAGGAVVLLTGDDENDEDDEQRQEYVDAITAAIVEDEDALVVTEDEAECLAVAYVDVIGLDTLGDAVTSEEIRDNPDDGLTDWGIEASPDQGREILDAWKRCVDDLGAAFAESFAADFPSVDAETAGECLADGIETDAVEDVLAQTMIRDDDADLTEDEANVMYDWMNGCMDFRTIFADTIAAELDDPGAADCVSAGLTDELLRDSFVANFTGDEEAEDDLDTEMQAVVADCTTEAGD